MNLCLRMKPPDFQSWPSCGRARGAPLGLSDPLSRLLGVVCTYGVLCNAWLFCPKIIISDNHRVVKAHFSVWDDVRREIYKMTAASMPTNGY